MKTRNMSVGHHDLSITNLLARLGRETRIRFHQSSVEWQASNDRSVCLMRKLRFLSHISFTWYCQLLDMTASNGYCARGKSGEKSRQQPMSSLFWLHYTAWSLSPSIHLSFALGCDEKEANELMAVTLWNLNRFSKFLHCWEEN